MTSLVLFDLFVKNLQLFEHQRTTAILADSLQEPMTKLNTAVVEGRMS